MTDYSQTFIELGYIVASILFILGIKMLGRPERARRGNLVSALGMLIAIVAVLFECCLDFTWVISGLVIGSAIGPGGSGPSCARSHDAVSSSRSLQNMTRKSTPRATGDNGCFMRSLMDRPTAGFEVER